MVNCYIFNFKQSNIYTKFPKHLIYSIIGTRARLCETCLFKSIFFPLYPHEAISVVLSIVNLILVFTCPTTSQYLSLLFLAMRFAMRSAKLFALLRHTSRCEKYSQGEGCLSTSKTLSKYLSFFSFIESC